MSTLTSQKLIKFKNTQMAVASKKWIKNLNKLRIKNLNKLIFIIKLSGLERNLHSNIFRSDRF